MQAAVGLYAGVSRDFSNENMQIEGFWYYLFLGVFEAAVIHYLVAKLLGPFLFGRGWCGYACWTAMVLDLLPYKTLRQDVRDAQELRKKRLGYIRYLVFLTSLLFVGALFVFHVPNLERVMFYSFLIGNALYYGKGLLLSAQG
ncbi:MAG: 4Fe-4S binding protein [Acutalibacter sp.]